MERGRGVREKHERRRRDVGLRGIHDAHFVAARARRRVRGGDLRDPSVQLPCRHALVARVGHPVDRLQQLRRPLAGQRGEVQDRRVVQKPHLAAQLVVELLRIVRPAPLHQVPLVGDDDDTRPGFLGFAGDRRVLVGRPLDRVDDEDGDVRLFDRPARDHDRDPLDLPRPRHASGPPDAGGVKNAERALLPLEHGVNRIPRRPRHVAHDRPLLAQQSIEERRLADVRPADDRHAGLDLLDRRRRLTSALGEARDDLVQQIPYSLPMLRGDFHDRLETQTVELDVPSLRPAVVCLVHGDDDGGVHRPQRGCYRLIAGDEPHPAVYDEHDKIRRSNGFAAMLDHQCMEGIGLGAKHAPCVDEGKVVALPLGGLGIGIPGPRSQ